MNKADFESLDASKVQGFLGTQEENLHLDFKQAKGDFSHADDRKNLAKVVAGFANSDGGVCIWGVDARKAKDSPDVAQSIVEIPDVTASVARLNELTSQAANPTVDGVLHKSITITGKAGVVATYVPASDSGPHMAKLGEDRYYKRSGESFVKMEHFDIEDMFGRRAKPKLSVTHRVESHASDMTFAVISIANSGRAAAISPYLSLLLEPPYGVHVHGIDGNGHHGLPIRLEYRSSKWETFGGVEGNLVYPGVTFDVTAIKLNKNPEATHRQPIIVRYRLAAANFRLLEGEFMIAQPY